MSVTMLPGGNTPVINWRPSTGTSKEDSMTPNEIANASQIAKTGGWSQDNYLDMLIERANRGDSAATDLLVNIFATRESEKTARDWTAQREDSAYQRLDADLKKAGISPYILSGATPGVSSSSGRTYSSSSYTGLEKNELSNRTDIARGSLALLGVVLMSLLHLI